jgi:hypothetical protein
VKAAALATLFLALPAHADREAARYVLEKHCGTCHREDSPEADPRALQIFDLNLPDFAASMSEQHLKDALERLESSRALTGDELKEMRRAERPTASDVTALRSFVEATLANRRAAVKKRASGSDRGTGSRAPAR